MVWSMLVATAAADGAIRPYGAAKAAPRPLRTSDGAPRRRGGHAAPAEQKRGPFSARRGDADVAANR